MGGSLVATSEGLGHGATFTLTLPVIQKDVKQTLATGTVSEIPAPSTPQPNLG